MKRIVLITGAAGNIGAKLAAHFRSTDAYQLRLLDKTPAEGIVPADFGKFDESWAQHFDGVDTIVHLAGNASGRASWASAKRDNIGGTQHVLRAAARAKVRRVIFASTNQTMLGYRFQDGPVTTDMPPAPLSPYGISKFVGEELGREFEDATGINFLAWRIGYFQRGENRPGSHMDIGEWGQSMWLSNRDMIQAAEKSIEAPDFGFAVVNLESNNRGMRWDIAHTRDVIGYVPLDEATPVMEAHNRQADDVARAKRLLPGQWYDEHFNEVEP